MILVDTSVWIDQFRQNDARLADLLNAGSVLIHPFVIGELALRTLRQRDEILTVLGFLPQATVAMNAEVLHFIAASHLAGLGIGHVDAHLLASARLTPGASLWTLDKRLSAAAVRDGVAAATLP